jgi:simple sugar transport system substrate-binding protein
VTHRWGDYYTARARAVLDGSWKSGAVWGGVKEGMIRVGDFGPRVPKAVQTEVLNAQKAMAQGKLQPFHAKEAVRDNEGQVVIAKGETLSDEKILGMNWLVAGVQGKLSH